MGDDIVDLSGAIEPEDMPRCPFCGDSILTWGPGGIFVAHASKALAHVQCIVEARDSLPPIEGEDDE